MSGHDERHNADGALAEELKAHHAMMVADLDRLSTVLATAAAAGDDVTEPRTALTEWIRDVLVPHAEEEEQTTYRAAGELSEGRLLIASMLAEHVLIRRVASLLVAAQDPAEAGAYGRALFQIFHSHQRKENEMILPLLVDEDTVSLAAVMSTAHGHGHGHGQSDAHIGDGEPRR